MVHIFMTGGTGFVGSAVLKVLLENREIETVKVLVRNKNKASKQFLELMYKGSQLEKKVIPIQGDITSPNFGLSSSELQSIQESDEVYHIAANTSLSTETNDKKPIFSTNVEGTRNLLEIFKNSKYLKKLFYFSSAYACGKIPELIKENWLEKPSNFRNHYEESKWASENLIKEYYEKYGILFIILRPGIISIGNNFKFKEDGENTIYRYGNILKEALKLQKNNDHQPMKLIGKHSSTLNIIPVDAIVKILMEIRETNKINSIFNLTNEINVTVLSICKGIEEGIEFKNGFILKEKLDYSPLSRSEKFAFIHTRPFWGYTLCDNLHWSIDNTKDIRKKLKMDVNDNKWIKEHMKNYFLRRSEHEKQKPVVQI